MNGCNTPHFPAAGFGLGGKPEFNATVTLPGQESA
jgi:hypothetical protein